MAIKHDDVSVMLQQRAVFFLNHYANSRTSFSIPHHNIGGNLSMNIKDRKVDFNDKTTINEIGAASADILKYKIKKELEFRNHNVDKIDIDLLLAKLGMNDGSIISPVMMEIVIKATEFSMRGAAKNSTQNAVSKVAANLALYTENYGDQISTLDPKQNRLLSKHIKYTPIESLKVSFEELIAKTKHGEEPVRAAKETYAKAVLRL